MSEIDPTRPPFQYSLRSLLVLTTVVAVLCSIGVSTRWGFPFKIAAGVATLYLGFGPLSIEKEPEPGVIFSFVAVLVRCLAFGFVVVAVRELLEGH